MASKIFITVCVQAVLFQTISCQIISNAFNPTVMGPGFDGPLSAIDVAFGPNELPTGSMPANEMAYGARLAANELAYGPRMGANDLAFAPRAAANELAYGARAANDMAYNSRLAANEIANSNRVANEMAYASRIAANDLAYGPKTAANELAYANMAANSLTLDGLPGYPMPAFDKVPASGGSFPVTSTSRLAPTGITVVSENTIEGLVAVNGELPVLAAVSLQGSLPTSGSGSIAYGCGNGAIGITNDGVGPAAVELAYGQRLANDAELARLGRVGYGAGVL